MNMKKAQWLKKPAHFDSSLLHSVTYSSSGRDEVFFTVGEEDEIKLSALAAGGVSLSFVFFHTPEDRVVFHEREIKLSWRGLKARTDVLNAITELEISKKGEEIVFSSSGAEILRIKNAAFLSSSSFGIVTEGSGSVTLSVW